MSKDDVTDPVVLRGRMIGLLERVAVEKRPCKLCGETIYLLNVSEKPSPNKPRTEWYGQTGAPHVLHCEKYNRDK